MKVILLSELRGKGGEGDIVEVSQGYAENYLFPNRIAVQATPGNIKQLEERRHNIELREAKRIADAEATRDALEGQTVTVDAKIGEEGQLFGSVTSPQIVAAIAEQLGVEIDRKRISKNVTIKTAGLHQVEVNLYREINATVSVLVGGEQYAPEEEADEAEAEETVEVAEEAAEVEVAEEAAEVEEEAAEVVEEKIGRAHV